MEDGLRRCTHSKEQQIVSRGEPARFRREVSLSGVSRRPLLSDRGEKVGAGIMKDFIKVSDLFLAKRSIRLRVATRQIEIEHDDLHKVEGNETNTDQKS